VLPLVVNTVFQKLREAVIKPLSLRYAATYRGYAINVAQITLSYFRFTRKMAGFTYNWYIHSFISPPNVIAKKYTKKQNLTKLN